MGTACPRCEDPSQVVNLPAFWRSLAPGAELKAELAQPPSYAPAWPLLLGLAVVGVIGLVAGVWVLGLLGILAAGGVGYAAWTSFAEAEAAREAWTRSPYCRRCPGVFLPEDAKVV